MRANRLVGPVLAASFSLTIGAMSVDAQRPQLPPTGFEVGEPFPAFALPSLESGEPVSISELRGHKVILHVFASW